ncbi:ribosomal protein L7/L12 [Pneumocystis carinii B80]|uniref:Ribosomal protein L7/L12 n=1 Tax=Pneumocystis carinii (strain B80) TaxID=1408658 RepID=A0A0W4ZLI3_PNEC8|nr:ribosomal protein L7/L12 [Pneumocystis carinii B80]KTW29241.1 ribosomal protein L7/L12 [Pneumocystis carinii B80]
MRQYEIKRLSNSLFRGSLRLFSKSQWIRRSSSLNPKILGIIDQISSLTLKETADLVSQLKIHLNVQDIRPIIAPTVAAESVPVPEEEKKQVKEKVFFNIKLESYDSAAKAKVIKEVKSMLGLNLVEAKKFVESSPKILKESVNKEDAENIKKTFEELGAKISLE